MIKRKAAITLVCDDCPSGQRAETDVDVLARDVIKTAADGRLTSQTFEQPMLPAGWEVTETAPLVKVPPSGENFPVFDTHPTMIARLTSTPQQTHRCPSCAAKAKDRAIVEGVGLRVVQGGA